MKNFLKNNLIAIFVCSFLVSTFAGAGVVTRIYEFSGGTKAVATQVNAEFDNIVDFINGGNIASNNIAALGITAANINSSAVTTAKIADLAVTTGKLADGAVTDAKLSISALTTTLIADGAVTRPKQAALTINKSGTVAIFTSTSTSFTDVTGLTVSITSTGRPIWVGLVCVHSSSPCSVYATNAASTNVEAEIKLLRDSVSIMNTYLLATGTFASNSQMRTPAGTIWYIDEPAAGTYTYKIQVAVQSGTTAGFEQLKLIAYEL
jgi:hypothetical protein